MNKKLIIVGIVIAVGLAVWASLIIISDTETLRTDSKFFNVDIINCRVVGIDSRELEYSITNTLDKNYRLELALLQTDINGDTVDERRVQVDILGGQTIHAKQLMSYVPEMNTCLIQIKDVIDLP
jgi:hypothetical protein